MRAFQLGLLAHLAAGLLEESPVEGGAEGGAAGEAGRADAVEELCAADAVGPVGEAEGGDAVLGEGLGVPEVGSWVGLSDEVTMVCC